MFAATALVWCLQVPTEARCTAALVAALTPMAASDLAACGASPMPPATDREALVIWWRSIPEDCL
jgi:hypothetical protein